MNVRCVRLLSLLSLVPSLVIAQRPATLTATRDLFIAPETADLTPAHFMAVSPRGQILVAQGRDGHIKVFGATGAVSTIGRRGEGPGEFRFVTAIGFVGDTLWAIDHALVRINRFGPDFRFVRSSAEPFSPVAPSGHYLNVYDFTRAVLPGGDLRANVKIPAMGARPAWAATLDSNARAVVRITAAGAFKQLLMVIPPPRPSCTVSAPFTHRNGNADIATARIPFCAEPLATDLQGVPGGVALVEVQSTARSGGSYRVRVVDEAGSLRFTRSIPYTPIAVARKDLDSLRRARAEYVKSPEYIAEMPNPAPAPSYPPIRRILLGRDYSVWLEEHTLAAGHRWLVLSPAGTLAGTVTLPAEVTLMVVEMGRAWGTVIDADGLEGIVRYRVGR